MTQTLTSTSTRLTDWFEQARYGMFIHWGPYSVAGRGEWLMNRECVPLAEYREKYVEPDDNPTVKKK